MTDYVWLIRSNEDNPFKPSGISSTYLVPKEAYNGLIEDICGTRLWICLRKNEDRCIAFVRVTAMHQFSEGYYAGDYLISCDTSLSFRLTSTYSSAANYSVDNLQSLEPGIHRLKPTNASSLCDMVTKSIHVKFNPPTTSALRGLSLPYIPKSLKSLVNTGISTITCNRNMDDLWKSGQNQKLGPFSNFAFPILHEHHKDRDALISLLENIDPVSVLGEELDPQEQAGSAIAQRAHLGMVDDNFSEIDPESVYARSFTSKAIFHDHDLMVQKTNYAEKKHQDMLRDITSYLRKIGVLSYQSNSIDLMIARNGGIEIFELKSANNSNILSQAAKGAFQLAHYTTSIEKNYNLLRSSLILEKISDPHIDSIAKKALTKLGVTCLEYDPQADWPDRLIGLI